MEPFPDEYLRLFEVTRIRLTQWRWFGPTTGFGLMRRYEYEPAFSRRCYAHILIVFAPRKRLRSLMEGRKKLWRKQPKLSTGQTLPASQSLTRSVSAWEHILDLYRVHFQKWQGNRAVSNPLERLVDCVSDPWMMLGGGTQMIYLSMVRKGALMPRMEEYFKWMPFGARPPAWEKETEYYGKTLLRPRGHKQTTLLFVYRSLSTPRIPPLPPPYFEHNWPGLPVGPKTSLREQ